MTLFTTFSRSWKRSFWNITKVLPRHSSHSLNIVNMKFHDHHSTYVSACMAMDNGPRYRYTIFSFDYETYLGNTFYYQTKCHEFHFTQISNRFALLSETFRVPFYKSYCDISHSREAARFGVNIIASLRNCHRYGSVWDRVIFWYLTAARHYLSQFRLVVNTRPPINITIHFSGNTLWPSDAIWRHRSGSTLVLSGNKPLIKPMLIYHPWASVTLTYTPPSKSLSSLWLAGQLVAIPQLKWPYFQEYHTEYFKISYDKC